VLLREDVAQRLETVFCAIVLLPFSSDFDTRDTFG
jgi:hypothetical protein